MSKHSNQSLLDRLQQTFISDRLIDGSLSDAQQRAKVLVGVLAISALAGAGLTLTLMISYSIIGELLYLVATLIALITTMGYLGTLWYFKWQQTLVPAANLYALSTTFSTLAPCLITGGVSASPYLALILVVPIFLFLIAGRRYGIYWSFVAVICVAILLALESFGLKFPQIIPPDSMALFGFTTWLMTLVLLVMGLIAYERSFERLNSRITEERGQFAYKALHDPLTGLSNRTQFFSRANEALDFALARRHKTAVIFVDLDDFKMINDGFGHDVGDEVLNAVAKRLQANVRSVDTVARLGGDEFAIVLHGIERVEVAELMVEKIQSVLQEPLIIGQHYLRTTGSVGVAVAPDQGVDVERLLRMADEAMYRAKEIRNEALAC